MKEISFSFDHFDATDRIICTMSEDLLINLVPTKASEVLKSNHQPHVAT